MAPKNFLSTPEEVFGEGKLFDKEVEEKTRLAFRVTMKKLDKLNTLSEERREELAREKIDQVVECFPNSLPEDLPKILGKTKWSMPAKEVSNTCRANSKMCEFSDGGLGSLVGDARTG